MLCPVLLYPEPLPLQQSTADRYLCRRHQTQFCLSLCGVSGFWCAQGMFEYSECLWWVWGLILNMISPPPTILLGRLCPWTRSIFSQSLHCHATAASSMLHPRWLLVKLEGILGGPLHQAPHFTVGETAELTPNLCYFKYAKLTVVIIFMRLESLIV